MTENRGYSPVLYQDLRAFFEDLRVYTVLLLQAASLGSETARVLALEKRHEICEKLLLHKKKNLILPIQWLSGALNLSAVETDLLFLFLVHYFGKPRLAPSEATNAHEAERTATLPAVMSIAQAVCLLQSEDLNEDPYGFGLRQSPLLQWKLIQIEDEPRLPPLHRAAYLDPRIADYLMGDTNLDLGLTAMAQLNRGVTEAPDSRISPQILEQLTSLAARWGHFEGMKPLLYLQGPMGCGQEEAVALFAGLLQQDLIRVALDAIPEPLAGNMQRLAREALLLQTGLHFCAHQALLDETVAQQIAVTLRELQPRITPLILEGSGPLSDDFDHFELTFERPAAQQRRQLWQAFLPEASASFDVVEPFPFTQQQIRNAAHSFRRRTQLNKDRPGSDRDALLQACRKQFGKGLDALAIKVKSPANWADLILPEEVIEQLREIPPHIAHRDQLYEEWGFQNKIHHGRGLNVLFTGVSGTGKTLSASVIANTLGMDLYRIDLASVVSKYIGETEKNLDRIFEKGNTSASILFFDEAESLFGKRSGITSSNDRHANLETGYLLQKMESYEGMTILATNLAGNMDEAFKRRMQFIVHFPFPKKEQRVQIFRNLLPKQVPLKGDIDFSFLAEKLEVTGGTIKNLVLSACFLAAGEGESVGMRHFLHAVRREWQKAERPFYSDDFAPYDCLL